MPDSISGDVDLMRARDLLELHTSVKIANSAAVTDRALYQARQDVEEALLHT